MNKISQQFNPVSFKKISNLQYDIIFENSVKLGELLKEVDGFFVWYPPYPPNGGCWEAYVLRIIADKLDELNKDWNKQIDDFFKEKTLDDGFGNSCSITCLTCGQDTMEIVRPGKVQCSNCG